MDQIALPTEDYPMLPSTFKVIHEGRCTHFVRAGYETSVLAERDASEGAPYARGRGAIRAFPLGDRGDRMLVRHCRRGGWFAVVARDLYFGRGRVVNEICVSECAREKGVPTALVLGARCERVAGPLCRADVVTKEIPDSCDLIRYFERNGGCCDYPSKQRLIEAVAGAIRKMHDAGVYHADLHLKNILIDAEGAAYVLDLDKARTVSSLGIGLRMANLLRLDRSVRKWQAARDSVTTVDRFRFLAAYAGADDDLREACRRLFRRRRSYLLHRLFWRLFGVDNPASRVTHGTTR